jgi:tetratricopeptide (TPR) repeat protein
MRQLRHPLTWLLLATALAYLNALVAGFQFDDFNIIVDNARVHSLAAWWQSMPGIRPLLKLSYTLNWISGTGASGFHVVNLLLHLLNVALLWHLSRFFPLPATWDADRRGTHARVLLTLLFALHPIQTESVTYISGRSMLLMTSFGLAALLCWLQAGQRARPMAWRALALVLFAAAILSKEVAVVLPLALLLLRGREPTPGWQLPLLALFVTATVLLLFALFGYQRLLSMPLPRGLFANLASEAHALYYLLGQLLRPHALNIDPDLPELTAWSVPLVLELSGIAGAILLAWQQRRHRCWLSFGIGWLVLMLLPTHTLIPRLDLASERHLYLSAMGLYWLAGVALVWLPTRLPTSAGTMLIVLLACTGAVFTAHRNQDYRDEVSLWQATVRLSPDKARAWNNLGYAQALAGQTPAARKAFQRTLELNPRHVRALANLRDLDAGRLGPAVSIPTVRPGITPEQ